MHWWWLWLKTSPGLSLDGRRLSEETPSWDFLTQKLRTFSPSSPSISSAQHKKINNNKNAIMKNWCTYYNIMQLPGNAKKHYCGSVTTLWWSYANYIQVQSSQRPICDARVVWCLKGLSLSYSKLSSLALSFLHIFCSPASTDSTDNE